MHLTNKGQSVLEYVLLATIVMVGIIIGGPILMKSVQGHFKLTDESVRDASTEVIEQAGTSGLSTKKCACSVMPVDLSTNPTTYIEQIKKWNGGECGAGKCGPTEKYYYRTCTPMKCGVEEVCLPDSECCSPAKPVGCGTMILPVDGADPDEEYKCNPGDRENPAPDAPKHRFSKDLPGAKRTCEHKDGGDTIDTQDCAVGERLYKKECANAADPTKIDTIYACKGPDEETELKCLPTCWQYPFPHSTPCSSDTSGSDTLEDDNNMPSENDLIDPDNSLYIPQRKILIKEVVYRQSDDNNGDNPPDVRQNKTEDERKAINDHFQKTLKSDHNPHRILTNLVETDDIMKFNAYRNHYTYLKSNQCKDERYCERLCPGGYSPNAEGVEGLHENESCVQNSCWYGWWPPQNFKKNKKIPGDRICSSQDEPKICESSSVKICGYLAVCSSPTGTKYQTSSNTSDKKYFDIFKLDDFASSCPDPYRKIFDPNNALSYCFILTPRCSDDPITDLPEKFECNAGKKGKDAKDNTLFYTVVGCD